MSVRCTGDPVSWMRLERYHLRELGGVDRLPIEQHLGACAACRACLAQIQHDDVDTLPPLEVRPSKNPLLGARPTKLGRLSLRWSTSLVATASLCAAAAAIALGVGRTRQATNDGLAHLDTSSVKGGGVALALVRDDGQTILPEGGVYQDGDRFKAVVTCPPTMHARFDLVVFDPAGAASFPIEPTEELACGNAVPLPGAFRLTGHGEQEACLGWSEDGAVDRSTLAREPVGEHAFCVRLSPAPEGDPRR